jgi:hypothetical protein
MRALLSPSLLTLSLVTSLSVACLDNDEGIDDGTDEAGSDYGSHESGDSSGDDEEGGDEGGEGGDAEAGDSLEEATAVVFDEDTAWGDALSEDSINPAGDRDFYMIDATEGYTYLIAAAADMAAEVGEPDTVMRLYNADGEQIDENDDMPMRFWGTDSAVFWQATYTGAYYVEVLEWSDWADAGALGGGSYDYELWGIETTQFYDVGANDTPEEADILAEKEINQGYWTNFFDETYYMYFGTLGETGDVDYWRYELTPTEEKGEDYQIAFSLWPSWGMDAFGFEMALYNGDNEKVAWTDAPGYDAYGGNWYPDTGIMYWATAGETYYLEVSSNNGSYGTGTFYPGFDAYYYTPEDEELETESNDTCDRADTVELIESETTPGYYYGALYATLDGDDVSDCFRLRADDIGSLEGMYLSAYVQGADLGSLLDSKITIYGDETAESTLAEASYSPDTEAGDPQIWDLTLGSDDDVYVQVDAEAQGASEGSNYYYIVLKAYDEPVNE